MDIKTVLVSYLLSNAICAVVIFSLWRQNRKQFNGLGFWLAAYLMQFTGLALVIMRDSLPDFVSMVVGNGFNIGGTLLLYMGLERFLGKRSNQFHNYVILALFVAAHTYFLFVRPNMTARSINLSLALIALSAQFVWLLFRRADVELRPMTRDAGFVFAAYGVVSLIRICVNSVMPLDEDFFRLDLFDTVVVMTYQMFFIALTFSLFMMVNRRLSMNLQEDVASRKRAEEALSLSEEKFSKAFYASPDAILISRIRDGLIVEVNEGFYHISEYTREEAVGVSALALNLWVNPADRETCMSVIATNGHIHDYEYDFSSKSGKRLQCLYSGELIELNGEAHVLSVVRDVTARRQMEEELQNRSNVLSSLHQITLDLINRHDVDDVMQSFMVHISRFLDASDVSFDLLESGDTLVTYAVTPGQPLQIGDTMRRGEGGWLSWQAVDSGQPAVLVDYSRWENRRELFENFPVHAVMIIPVSQGERVIGAINISRREENKPFTETDVNAAQQLAHVAALMLDNAKLYAQLQSELVERGQAEENLRVFSRVVEQNQSAVIITDTNGTIEYVNPRFTELTGFSMEEARGQNPRILRPTDASSEVYAKMWETILAGQVWQGELQSRKKNGELFWDETMISPVTNEQGAMTHFVSIKEDITERKRAESALLQLTAFEERQRLARDLHDSVNQSIHSLVLFSETLISTLQKNNVTRSIQIAKRLQESARQALKEVRLMLYEFQLTEPEREINFIQDLETRLSTVERRAGVRAQVIHEGKMEYCPREWYENLFWITIEALNNALKHAQARNILVIVECSLQSVDLEIVDDGIGFDPTKVRSGGFGLRTMRERSDLLGGEITIISSPGNGSRVCFHSDIKKGRGMRS